MLTSLRIQNFRSIRDASVKLGQVNLFIGPNNSGKSNYLKGVELIAGLLSNSNKAPHAGRDNLPKELQHRPYDSPATMAFTTVADLTDGKHTAVLTWLTDDVIQQRILIQKNSIKIPLDSNLGIINGEFQSTPRELYSMTKNTLIYNTNPERLKTSSNLRSISILSPDGADLVLFLFHLDQNHKPHFNRLVDDLKNCVQDIVAITTPADPDEPGKLKLKFFDQKGTAYWAEEVSEGVLYFLALLCIVHQPDPPKLLLLEEPEKGIHPRRIKEVMDFIFELARLRDIQIILTSHSPYVVDHFADIPECISVFDRENGETVIHNAADIIAETNAKLEAAGQEAIHYTDALGEYWVSGFLGGVPEVLGA
ncbi:AAA family ATPase [Hymenobacter psoromatis]|uniref:AAA family ATPase n=1 Tax=Hymenobacter psoromatis TaxID=1484116 RepID=UPI001CC079F6|nr:AAA family ATPase [Hymenobacter psoromatis]